MPHAIPPPADCRGCRRFGPIRARGLCTRCYAALKVAGLPPLPRAPRPPCERCGITVKRASYRFCDACRAVVRAARWAGKPPPAAPAVTPAPPTERAPTAPRQHRVDRVLTAWTAGVSEAEVRGWEASPVRALVTPETWAEAVRWVARKGAPP